MVYHSCERETHISFVRLRRVNDWFRNIALAGAASIEAGGRNGYLHVQVVGRIRMMADEAGRKAIRQHMKSFVPVQHGSSAPWVPKITLETLGRASSLPLAERSDVLCRWDHRCGASRDRPTLGVHARVHPESLGDAALQ